MPTERLMDMTEEDNALRKSLKRDLSLAFNDSVAKNCKGVVKEVMDDDGKFQYSIELDPSVSVLAAIVDALVQQTATIVAGICAGVEVSGDIEQSKEYREYMLKQIVDEFVSNFNNDIEKSVRNLIYIVYDSGYRFYLHRIQTTRG